MKKEFICVYFFDFIMGGIESYFFRMLQWAISNDYEASLIILKGKSLHENWKPLFEQSNIQTCYFQSGLITNRISYSDGSIKNFDEGKEYIVVTTDIHEYLKFHSIKEKNNLINMKIVLYSFALAKGVGSSKNILNKPFHILFEKIKDSSLIFMDEECRDFCAQKNNLEFQKNNIVRLGITIPELDEEMINNRAKSKNDIFTILTITRFDFPFKGYVLGLLDAFKVLKEEYSHVKLVIVGNGVGYEMVQKKLDELPQNVRDSVEVHDEVPYEELKKFFVTSHAHIGMGTTLLDAAITGLCGINVASYQYGQKTSGFFLNEPNNLSAYDAISKNKDAKVIDYLKKLIECSEEEYISYSVKTYQAAKNTYDIEKIMPQIIGLKASTNFEGIKCVFARCYANFFAQLRFLERSLQSIRK